MDNEQREKEITEKQKIIISSMPKLKLCPFCGGTTLIGIQGDMVSLDCDGDGCYVSMVYYKSNCLTPDEMKAYEGNGWMYSIEAEIKVLAKVATLWNTRV